MNNHFTLGLVRSLFSNHRNHKKFLYSLRLDVKALEHLLNVTHRGRRPFLFEIVSTLQSRNSADLGLGANVFLVIRFRSSISRSTVTRLTKTALVLECLSLHTRSIMVSCLRCEAAVSTAWLLGVWRYPREKQG